MDSSAASVPPSVRLFLPHMERSLEPPTAIPLTVGVIRMQFAEMLGLPLSQTGVYRLRNDTIEIFQQVHDEVTLNTDSDGDITLYGGQCHNDMQTAREQLCTTNYVIHISAFNSARSSFSIGPRERVSDLLERIHSAMPEQFSSPAHIRLQSLIPNMPIISNTRDEIRSVLPAGSVIYALSTTHPEPQHRTYDVIRHNNSAFSHSVQALKKVNRKRRSCNAIQSDSDQCNVDAPACDYDSVDPLDDTSISTCPNSMPSMKRRRLQRFSRHGYVENIPAIARIRQSGKGSNSYDASISASSTFQASSPQQGNMRTRQTRQQMQHEVETSNITDDALVQDACCNCHRSPRSPTLQPVPATPYEPRFITVDINRDLRLRNRQKFVYINLANYPVTQGGTRMARICAECYAYLSVPADTQPPASIVWPAFIWSTLMAADTFSEAWKLIPTQWKAWWIRAVSQQHNQSSALLLQQPSVFVDRTSSQRADVAALKGLVWSSDVVPRELSLVLTEVKCPAGCGEFKHKTNAIGMDIVWQYLLQVPLRQYSSKSSNASTRWFRRDFTIHDNVLWNPEWNCTPSISYCPDKMAPMVLTCRYHGKKNNKYMLHPCRHPLGTIATEKASQFSPVTPIPRTLKKAQYSAYSGSFRVAKMEGSFHGLDTMFLAADGGNFDYQSKLAWEFERVSVHHRSDLKEHVSQLSQDNKITHVLAATLTEPTQPVPAALTDGSTYVSVDDAIRLQNNLFYGRNELTRIPGQIGSTLVSFMGQWPRHLFHIHPAGSTYGSAPFCAPSFATGSCSKYDARSGWLLSSILLCIPEVWEATTTSFKAFDSWEGWLLAYLTKNCLTHLSLKGSKSPFKCINQDKLFEEYIQPHRHRPYEPEVLFHKFNPPTPPQIRKYTNILCQYNSFRPPQEQCKNIVMVFNTTQRPRRGTVPRIFTATYTDWKLRFVAFSNASGSPVNHPQNWKGTVYTRHIGKDHSSWWRIPKGTTMPLKCPESWTVPQLGESARNWSICVFTRTTPFIGSQQRDSILKSCGGQTRVKCSVHSHPLIITPRSATSVCYTNINDQNPCASLCRYICPERHCTVGVCKNHYSALPFHTTEFISLDPPSDACRSKIVRNRQRHTTTNNAQHATIVPPPLGLPTINTNMV